jgi:hypothetical protein
MKCQKCERETKFGYALCFRCYQSQKVQEAYQAGYSAGRGLTERDEIPPFTKAQLRRIIQLCHPDKHGGSKASVEVTQILTAMLERFS